MTTRGGQSASRWCATSHHKDSHCKEAGKQVLLTTDEHESVLSVGTVSCWGHCG